MMYRRIMLPCCSWLAWSPLYFGYSELNPSALKLWITSRTRSSLVKATLAIPATSMPCADSSHEGLTKAYARRTPLLRGMQEAIALALAGRAGHAWRPDSGYRPGGRRGAGPGLDGLPRAAGSSPGPSIVQESRDAIAAEQHDGAGGRVVSHRWTQPGGW